MAGTKRNYRLWLIVCVIVSAAESALASDVLPEAARVLTLLPGFRQSPWFHEQLREEWLDPGVRLLINVPENFDPARPTDLIIYATPNGNTIEQTLGTGLTKGTDWHFDIQHIAAQTRQLRTVAPDKNIVLTCIQTESRSWPAWRQQNKDNAVQIRSIVEDIKERVTGRRTRITLAGHSGGGSFIFGFLNGSEAIPDDVHRIAFLDANYAYSDSDHHGEKLLAWLRKDKSRHLEVIAYDDREIMLDGKKVVGPEGGTYRATQRMLAFFRKSMTLRETRDTQFTKTTALGEQISIRVHANRENKILHTALVGEMNGFLMAMTTQTPEAAAWGTFGGPRAYTKWIQPPPGIPARPAGAVGGAAFLKRIESLDPAVREQAIAGEILRGNIPDFLRTFQTVELAAKDAAGHEQKVVVEAMPDYLAVGSDEDFVRIPMTPLTAQRIAEAFDCVLPTRKLVDAIFVASRVKLEPRPLTEAREAPATFAQHNRIIEEQRVGRPLGLLVAGIKKDVVLTNRLSEKPNRVAIYGWHKADGMPIQPLTIVHKASYVDYSQGIRLLKRSALVDGKPRDIRDLLRDPGLSDALSDEGPILRPTY